jgi:hypothetical protein
VLQLPVTAPVNPPVRTAESTPEARTLPVD